MTSSLLSGVLRHMSTPFDYHVQVPNNMKTWDKSHLRKGLPSDSSLIPTISNRDTQCQHVPNEGCHFLPKRVPAQCVRLNVSSLLLGMLLSFVNTHLLYVYITNIHYNRIWFFVQQYALAHDKCEISYVISDISM